MFTAKKPCTGYVLALLTGFCATFFGSAGNAQEPGGLLRPSLNTGLQDVGDKLPPDNALAVQPVFGSGPIGQTSSNGELQATDNQAAASVQGRKSGEADNPFEAVGIPLGRFRLFPVFEQSFGATTNADEISNSRGSGFSLSNARVSLQSDWSRHELRGELGVSAQKFFNGVTDTRLDADARADLRFDVRDGWAVRLKADYDQSTENLLTDALSGGGALTATERPGTREFGGSLGLERTGGKLNGSINATVRRSTFGTVNFSDGTGDAQEDRDNTEWKATGRLSYRLSPAFSPFVETSVGRRIFDVEFDSDSIRRDANLFDLRGGIAFELADKLRGEIAAGYGLEDYDASAISNLDGVTFNGSIVWSPEQLTTITTSVETELAGSSGLSDPGSITYTGGLLVERQVRSDLSVNGRVSAAWQSDEGGGSERTFQVEAGAIWYLNRWAAITGRIGYESTDSSDADESYDAATARIGLRLQR